MSSELEHGVQGIQASVGSKIDVGHTAATLLGQTVTATATVTEGDRRRVVFDLPSFQNRLAAKADQVGAGQLG